MASGPSSPSSRTITPPAPPVPLLDVVVVVVPELLAMPELLVVPELLAVVVVAPELLVMLVVVPAPPPPLPSVYGSPRTWRQPAPAEAPRAPTTAAATSARFIADLARKEASPQDRRPPPARQGTRRAARSRDRSCFRRAARDPPAVAVPLPRKPPCLRPGDRVAVL